LDLSRHRRPSGNRLGHRPEVERPRGALVLRLGCIAMILAGIVGLKLTTR
jgi:hypothetical protein